jgi:hypothetical protein
LISGKLSDEKFPFYKDEKIISKNENISNNDEISSLRKITQPRWNSEKTKRTSVFIKDFNNY